MPEYLHIKLDRLFRDPAQPRKTFLDDEIARLAVSMNSRGVLHPLRVRQDESGDGYYIITGESRWRAARIAGLESVPCLLVTDDLSETDILSDQIIENTLRNALKPMELARSLSKLKALKRCSAQELAAELGMSGASFSRAAGIATLPFAAKASASRGASAWAGCWWRCWPCCAPAFARWLPSTCQDHRRHW